MSLLLDLLPLFDDDEPDVTDRVVVELLRAARDQRLGLQMGGPRERRGRAGQPPAPPRRFR